MCDGPAGIPAGSPSCQGCLDAAATSRIGVFYSWLSCTPWCNNTTLDRVFFSPASDGLSLCSEVSETPSHVICGPKGSAECSIPPLPFQFRQPNSLQGLKSFCQELGKAAVSSGKTQDSRQHVPPALNSRSREPSDKEKVESLAEQSPSHMTSQHAQ